MSAAAIVPGPAHQLVTFWPLLASPRVPMDALISAAAPQLADRARQAGGILAGPPSWRRCPGTKCPGAGAHREVLMCTVPVVKVARNRDTIADRLTGATS